MWGSMPQVNSFTPIKPTATAGTIINASYSYDADESPWATKSTVALVAGSAVAGTPDEVDVVISGFPAISKSNFNSVRLVLVFDASLNSVGVNGSYADTAVLQIEYSLDGGGSWTVWSITESEWDLLPSPSFPAREVTGATVVAVGNTTVTKGAISATIPAASLDVGLNSIQFRFRLSTLTSTKAGNPKSSGEYGIWDIRAEIS